jgi:hypothetical protein
MTAVNWTWSLSDAVLLILAAGALLYFWGTSTYSRFTKQGIPHIKPLPVLGTMGSTICNNRPFTDMIQDDYNHFKDSPYGVVFIFRQPVVLLRDLELIKACAIKDFEYFTDHRMIFAQKESVWSKALISLKGTYILVPHVQSVHKVPMHVQSVHNVPILCISTVSAECP